jgi:hypothetical protein
VLSRLRSRLTYANVMATLGVFLALGGTSVAAVSLKRGSVKAKHIAANAVTSAKVKNGSLLPEDFKGGQLPKGERGAAGERGAQGEAGRQGDNGTNGEQGRQGVQGDQGPGAVKFVFEEAPGPSPTTRSTVVGPWTVVTYCSSIAGTTFLDVGVHGPGQAQFTKLISLNDAASPTLRTGGVALDPTTDSFVLQSSAASGEFQRVAGDIQLHSGSQVATVSLNGLADRRGAAPGTCALYGTGVPAG